MTDKKTITYNFEITSETELSNEDILSIKERLELYSRWEEILGLCNKSKEREREYKKKFFNEETFKKHIDALPKYHRLTRSKYEYHIKDYLLKNRSARLNDIVKGCKDLGLKVDAKNPKSMFYKSLRNLINSGHVTKHDHVYVWNYLS